MAGKFTVAVNDKGQLTAPFNTGDGLDFISKNDIARQSKLEAVDAKTIANAKTIATKADKVAKYSMTSRSVAANGTITLEAGKYYVVKSATSTNTIDVAVNGTEVYVEVVTGNNIILSVSDTLVAKMSEACTVIIESIVL